MAGGTEIQVSCPEDIAWDAESRTAVRRSGFAWEMADDIDQITSLKHAPRPESEGVAPMATIATTRPASPAPPGTRRITVDEYERIIRSGAIRDPDRVELIDGYMVDKMGKSAEHGYATRKLIDRFGPLTGPGWTWRSEQPVRIPLFDEPEPDLTIVRGSTEDYAHRIPGPTDVGLLIEVSLATLDTDRGTKLSHYAAGGIAVYWIVNLVHRRIEVYSRPVKAGRYRSHKDFLPGQQVPVVIDGRRLGFVAVDDILPPEPAADRAEGNGA
jgi:Uma2 family endonuclease